MHNLPLRVAISSASFPLGMGLGNRSKHPGRSKLWGPPSLCGSSVDFILGKPEGTGAHWSWGRQQVGRDK